jgi:general secretion pathway protein D
MPSRPANVSAEPMRVSRLMTLKSGLRLTSLSLALLIAGCAAQIAYRDGNELVAQDRIEQGLAKYQQALSSEPNNPQYKAAYIRTRERAVATFTHNADMLTAAGKSGEAEALYQRALAIDPINERAKSGLQTLTGDKRRAQVMQDAQSAVDRQDIGAAQFKLSYLLAENPSHEGALALKRSIAEKESRPATDTSLSASYKKPISIEFRDAELRQVFEVVSMSSGLNFVFDKDVKTDQRTSIFLKNSTVESAVYMLLVSNQLEQQVLDANTILIYPNTLAKQKDYQQLVVKSFFLTNADAKTVGNTVKTIVKSRDIVVDEKLNMIIVRDSPEAIKLVEKLVALHDTPEAEVMLEVEVLEVNRSRLQELGIQWPSSVGLTALPGVTAPVLADFGRNLRGLNSRTIGVGVGPATINAKQDDTDANLLANPRIRVRNHEKAKVVVGDKIPIISATTSQSTTVPLTSETITYLDVGLKLEVEPTVYLDNDVAIKIALEVNNLGTAVTTNSGSVAYRVGTRTATTVLRLKDGENQVLAGLINDEDRKSANKVPGLGEIPLLGRLFGNTTNNNDKTEIVLSITPHVIRNVQRPSLAMSEFRSGTDSGFRIAPDNAARAPIALQPVASLATAFVPLLPVVPVVQTAPVAAVAPASAVSNNSNALAIPATTPSPAAPADDPAAKSMFIEWMGRTQLKVGDPFDVQIIMESKKPVAAITASLGFDTSAMQLVGIEESDFLKQGGAQTTFDSQVDATGKISLKARRIADNGSGGATTPATMATLHFRAMAPSEGALVKLLTMIPVDAAGHALATPEVTPHVVRIQK